METCSCMYCGYDFDFDEEFDEDKNVCPDCLEFIEVSEPYVCRPPQQNDYRVYLTMKKKPGEQFGEFYDMEAIASGQPPPFSLILSPNSAAPKAVPIDN